MMYDAAPSPLTRREKAVVAGVALLCGASRFLAIAHSPWEWDEVQFLLAMRDYDVTAHQPHPPGFPLFIGLAKLVRMVIASDFRALQTLSVIASLLVFPALFLLARELRFDFKVSVIAGALFAFLPNVWFFGGTAFSDVPSVVLVLFAVLFLFRGRRSRNAYWLGALLLALSVGIRPQNLLVGAFPALYASWRRKPAEIVAALAIGIAVTVAAFGGAIYATGSWEAYSRSVREHSDYIARVDSWRSEVRPPMWRLFDRFFLLQYQSRMLSIVTSLLVIVAFVGWLRDRSRPMLFNLLTFGPLALFAWAMLDRYSISRFAIAYQPMFALLAADGLRRAVARMAPSTSPETGPRGDDPLAAAAVVFIGAFAVWTFPALTSVRKDVAPPLQAVDAVARHVNRESEHLFVAHTMTRFVDLYLPQFPYTRVIDDRAIPLSEEGRSWILAEINRSAEEGFVFRRPRGRLWNIARHHYFEVKLAPLARRARFLSGWYARESNGVDEWRWMSRSSNMELPPWTGDAKLRLHLGVPAETAAQSPTIRIRLNGEVIADFSTRDPYLELDYRVAAAGEDRLNVLEISIDRTVMPAGDSRELGLRLVYLAWGRP